MFSGRQFTNYLQTHPLTAILLCIFIILMGTATYSVATNKNFAFTGNGIFLQNTGTYARGQIIVTFDVQNYNDAIDVLTAFKRTFELIESQSSGNIYVFQVDVPDGQEQQWIDKFQGVQGVVSAHFAYLK